MVSITVPTPGLEDDIWGPIVNAALEALEDAVNELGARTVTTTTDTGSLTVNADNTKGAEVTALNQTLTVNAPTGTPGRQQQILFAFRDDGGAEDIIWNGVFNPVGVVLPETTVAGKWTYVLAIRNVTTSEWDVIAVTTEA